MTEISLLMNVLVFALATLVIVLSGSRLSFLADRLADRTGMGEAMTGAILLGAMTSLPGITTSIVSAASGYPKLAMSNALGGIAAQTAFLAVADFFYRRANLEHAAASVPNLLNGVLLIALLGGILVGANAPDVSWLGIHPVTPFLFFAYLFGLRLVREGHREPLWKPHRTEQTRVDVPTHRDSQESLTSLWIKFLALGTIAALSGWVVAQSGIALTLKLGWKESLIGGVFTAVATSTPELVTTIAAVRVGALTLAVGGILGGNAFDVMFAVAADVAYRPGSVYHTMGAEERFLAALAVVMTSVLVAGLISREKKGFANIGYESVIILALYLIGFLMLTLT